MKIKNWNTFQHFKDRRPPWIKLHREILDQRDINTISDRSFRVLVGLWLLASEDAQMEGRLPSIDDICFRLRMEKSCVNKALKELEPFLYRDDIKMISSQYQDDVPETEERHIDKTYKEEGDIVCLKAKKPHRLPKDWDCSEELGNWAVKEGLTKAQVISEIDNFIDHWTAAAGKGSSALDWDAKFRTWIRNQVKWQNERKVK